MEYNYRTCFIKRWNNHKHFHLSKITFNFVNQLTTEVKDHSYSTNYCILNVHLYIVCSCKTNTVVTILIKQTSSIESLYRVKLTVEPIQNLARTFWNQFVSQLAYKNNKWNITLYFEICSIFYIILYILQYNKILYNVISNLYILIGTLVCFYITHKIGVDMVYKLINTKAWYWTLMIR